jgi:hypothetical protein
MGLKLIFRGDKALEEKALEEWIKFVNLPDDSRPQAMRDLFRGFSVDLNGMEIPIELQKGHFKIYLTPEHIQSSEPSGDDAAMQIDCDFLVKELELPFYKFGRKDLAQPVLHLLEKALDDKPGKQEIYQKMENRDYVVDCFFAGVSHEHFIIYEDRVYGLQIADIGSYTGTWVNRRKIGLLENCDALRKVNEDVVQCMQKHRERSVEILTHSQPYCVVKLAEARDVLSRIANYGIAEAFDNKGNCEIVLGRAYSDDDYKFILKR